MQFFAVDKPAAPSGRYGIHTYRYLCLAIRSIVPFSVGGKLIATQVNNQMGSNYNMSQQSHRCGNFPG